jgi:hypothetical protein
MKNMMGIFAGLWNHQHERAGGNLQGHTADRFRAGQGHPYIGFYTKNNSLNPNGSVRIFQKNIP